MSTSAVDAETARSGSYIVLDDDDRVVHVSAALHERLGRWLGHVLWEHLPGARDVYGPAFDDARASGETVVAIVFYSGRLKRLTVSPAVDGLAVHVEPIAELDITSLGTLTRSLERIERELAARAHEQHDPRLPASLRALP